METVIIAGKPYNIEYRETKIDDTIYNKNTKDTYIATIMDADDLNWIVTNEVFDFDEVKTALLNFDFDEFKTFLLNYDQCTTEEMERAIELVYQYINKCNHMKNTDENPNIFPASQVNMVRPLYENVHIQIGEDWYYMTYEDLTKVLQKSSSKLKVVPKRTRTWVEPIK